jgi:hypothetical protein
MIVYGDDERNPAHDVRDCEGSTLSVNGEGDILSKERRRTEEDLIEGVAKDDRRRDRCETKCDGRNASSEDGRALQTERERDDIEDSVKEGTEHEHSTGETVEKVELRRSGGKGSAKEGRLTERNKSTHLLIALADDGDQRVLCREEEDGWDLSDSTEARMGSAKAASRDQGETHAM